MVNINLYHNTSDPNVLGKSITALQGTQGTMKKATSIINPVFTVKGDVGSIAGLNYCYVPQFHRYYFINDIVSVRNDLWQISCHCDVLETYKAGLLDTSAVIARQEYNYNLLLDDGSLRSTANPIVITKESNKSFKDKGNTFVLTTVGDYTTD